MTSWKLPLLESALDYRLSFSYVMINPRENANVKFCQSYLNNFYETIIVSRVKKTKYSHCKAKSSKAKV